MRKIYSWLIAFLFCNTVWSQKQVEDRLFKVNALLPGINYEFGTGVQSTLNLEVGLIPDWDGAFDVFPYLGADYRIFTNLERRLAKGKNVSGNSGDYIAFSNRVQITTPLVGNFEYDNPFLYVVGIVYGIQRTYSKGFYWGISGGPAFFTGDNEPGMGLLVDLKIGWVLSQQKKN